MIIKTTSKKKISLMFNYLFLVFENKTKNKYLYKYLYKMFSIQ